MDFNQSSPGRTVSRTHTLASRRHLDYETRIFLMALAAGLPGSIIASILLVSGGYSFKVQITLGLLIVICWFGFAFALRERVVTTLRTLSNLLAAFHEGDYSLRAVHRAGSDSLQEVAVEINALGDTLRAQRLSAMESALLLQKVMDEIDVAVLAFDEQSHLRILNQHAQLLLNKPESALVGSTAGELGLTNILQGESPRVIDLTAPAGNGRWELRRCEFRLNGKTHQLAVLSDLTRTLREEERQAWKKLVQVLRHEINNSLAPIHSLADSMASLLARDPRPEDWENDLTQGLHVISERSASLNRFMATYSRLTKLPKPNLKPLEVEQWIQRLVNLEPYPAIDLVPGPKIKIQADSDQLDLALINLLKNASEAAMETGGRVHVSWEMMEKPFHRLEIIIKDEGPGILNAENLFVPFFTTKKHGAGLGLMLARQIAEAHHGSLTLENRSGQSGCEARLKLPI